MLKAEESPDTYSVNDGDGVYRHGGKLMVRAGRSIVSGWHALRNHGRSLRGAEPLPHAARRRMIPLRTLLQHHVTAHLVPGEDEILEILCHRLAEPLSRFERVLGTWTDAVLEAETAPDRPAHHRVSGGDGVGEEAPALRKTEASGGDAAPDAGKHARAIRNTVADLDAALASLALDDLTRPLEEALAGASDASRHDYFEQLARLAGQNVLLALVYWVRSVRIDAETSTVQVRALEPISFAFIDAFTLSQSFTLKAFMDHATLTLAEHDRIFRVSRAETHHMFESLGNLLVIEPAHTAERVSQFVFTTIDDRQRYRIRPLVVHPVLMHLRSKKHRGVKVRDTPPPPWSRKRPKRRLGFLSLCMEPAGVEPASANRSLVASTCVVRCSYSLVRSAASGRPPHGPVPLDLAPGPQDGIREPARFDRRPQPDLGPGPEEDGCARVTYAASASELLALVFVPVA